MTCGLTKIIATREYLYAEELRPDLRVIFSDPENVERITSWFREHGYEIEVTEEI